MKLTQPLKVELQDVPIAAEPQKRMGFTVQVRDGINVWLVKFPSRVRSVHLSHLATFADSRNLSWVK